MIGRRTAISGAGAALALAAASAARGAPGAKTAMTERTAEHTPEQSAAVAGAMKCLDDFMTAFNARDVKAFEATFNFPSIRIASGKVVVIEPGYHKPQMFETGALSDWDHSAWERREVIHAGADKVHIDTRFSRYRKDGSLIGGFDSIYVVTRVDGHWGVQARSSFAP